MKPEEKPATKKDDIVIALKNNPFKLTAGSFLPGQAENFCSSLSDDFSRTVANAELYYYRGFAEKARECVTSLKTGGDGGIAAIYLIDTITAIATGDINSIKTINSFITATASIEGISPESKKTLKFAKLFFNILTHNSNDMTVPATDINAFAVPAELRPMAVYAYAHYLLITGDYGRAIGLAEGILININGTYTVSEIYLMLIVSIGCLCRKEWEKAEYFFKLAWKKALPDEFFMPFAEFKTMLSGMLEKCIKKDYPKEYKFISSLAANYHTNWVFIHNSLTGEQVTDALTPTETNIAVLASRGLSNTEISEFLDCSVNSVRSHLRNIFEKLDIASRKELSDYIIK